MRDEAKDAYDSDEDASSLASAVEDMFREAADARLHGELVGRLEKLQARVERAVVSRRGAGLRRALVALCCRLAAGVGRLGGADVVELLGAERAGAAVVDAFSLVRGDGRAVLERWAACLEDVTLPLAYWRRAEDEEPMARRAKAFGERVAAVAEALVGSGCLPTFFGDYSPPEAGDAALASVLGALANVMTYATGFQAKLRRHVAAECEDLADVVLALIDRCRSAPDPKAWPRALLAVRVLVVATFKLRQPRRAVCERNPTLPLLAQCNVGDRAGRGALLALLVKLNANVEGGFGPGWRADAERHAEALQVAAARLGGSSVREASTMYDAASPREDARARDAGAPAREMLARHLALHDGVPVNRGSRSWPLFAPLAGRKARSRADTPSTAAGSPVSITTAEAKPESLEDSFCEDAFRDPSAFRDPAPVRAEAKAGPSPVNRAGAKLLSGFRAPVSSPVPLLTPAASHAPSPAFGASASGDNRAFFERLAKALADVESSPAASPVKFGASGAFPESAAPPKLDATWTPHRLPPLAPPEALLCGLTGALMDEPAVDRAALADYLEAHPGRWPLSDAPRPEAADADALPLDDVLARRVAKFRYAALVPADREPAWGAPPLACPLAPAPLRPGAKDQ